MSGSGREEGAGAGAAGAEGGVGAAAGGGRAGAGVGRAGAVEGRQTMLTMLVVLPGLLVLTD